MLHFSMKVEVDDASLLGLHVRIEIRGSLKKIGVGVKILSMFYLFTFSFNVLYVVWFLLSSPFFPLFFSSKNLNTFRISSSTVSSPTTDWDNWGSGSTDTGKERESSSRHQKRSSKKKSSSSGGSSSSKGAKESLLIDFAEEKGNASGDWKDSKWGKETTEEDPWDILNK